MSAPPTDTPGPAGAATLAGWKSTVALVCAILLGLLFLVSGGWKVLNPFQTGELLEQARVPAGWGVPGASTLGAIELFAAFLLFLPRLRKLGGLLASGLLVFFIGWVAFFYNALAGKECSCFPIIKRTIGPTFFIGDGVMLLFAIVAFFWSPPVRRFRVPAVAFAALALFAAASYGVSASQHHGLAAPNPIVIDGKSQSIAEGKVFLFFYDPQCLVCDAAARSMAKFDWGDTRIVGIPTAEPEFAASFVHDTKIKAATCLETDRLRKVFTFVDPPYGVALVDGRQVAAFSTAQFQPPAPKAALEKLGFVK